MSIIKFYCFSILDSLEYFKLLTGNINFKMKKRTYCASFKLKVFNEAKNENIHKTAENIN